ncbi:MAG: hypothetical protein ACREEE_14155 [Dongiaceae bacterium]
MMSSALRRMNQVGRPADRDQAWLLDRDGTDRFVWQLDALLRRLGEVHLRISLARLSIEGADRQGLQLAQAIAENLLDPCAMAGSMPDGSVVAAFLGPRSGAGVAGDDEIARRIRRRFQRAMSAVAVQATLGPSRLAIVHGWTDEICDPAAVTHELQVAPTVLVNHIQAA